jgi:hypothetical protein
VRCPTGRANHPLVGAPLLYAIYDGCDHRADHHDRPRALDIGTLDLSDAIRAAFDLD